MFFFSVLVLHIYTFSKSTIVCGLHMVISLGLSRFFFVLVCGCVRIIIVFFNLNKISRDFSFRFSVLFWIRIYGSRSKDFFFLLRWEKHMLYHENFVLINMCQKLNQLYVSEFII